ncbi:hypothetical protein [Sediminicoccus sp. KRV36]|uniref:hypothetical protein n=1 Tax=Sediminicoccus sp. KRV36 TaxID=3133721 RepID=UPI00200DAF84|nr:hypothetical protein [Sediminicoccus rosea]UPY37103.1 hypothetical protein LHU95_23290 [Sediminicoccus rosea]
MRPVLILAALSPLLMGQGLPRPLCAYGEGLSALRDVERQSALPVPGVTEGRARGEVVVSALQNAAGIFSGCGCPRLAELTREAVLVAQSAPSEASVARLSQVFSQIRFRAQLVREQSERQGCR